MQNIRRSNSKSLVRHPIRRSVFKKRTEELETAIKTVLHYISSHQVYDKDAKGILTKALYNSGS